ncbi:hypothetical protein ACHZ98_20630 [Streptomyces sp. MAR4 CNY-716]
MERGGDVIDELTTDHREVEEFSEQIRQAPLGSHERRRLLDRPTVEHPATPSTPPANRLLDPGAGLVDRARDLVTGRGK